MRKQKHPHEVPGKIVQQLTKLVEKAKGVLSPLQDNDPELVTYIVSMPDGAQGLYRIRFPKIA